MEGIFNDDSLEIPFRFKTNAPFLDTRFDYQQSTNSPLNFY
jgi:hypothetical protein